MPTYAVTAAYTAEHWARLTQTPVAAGVGLRRALAGAGGTVTSMHWALDTLELVAIVAAPDAARMAGVSVTMAASGVFSTFTSRQLLDAAELEEVLATAAAPVAAADPPEGDEAQRR
jgi:uncharacterized protein with GYD domain